MCAVFGILGDYSPSLARKSIELMVHRGPNHCGIIEQNQLFFAHNRLNIVDQDKRSNQPFIYKDILLNFNGEIYNFKELKKELDFDFKTSSDTEVIIASYLKWGVDFVNKLEGMFVIAIYDKDKLLIFRDRFGKKPLYYTNGKSFIFASELKAIKVHLKHKELNIDALHSYLAFLAPSFDQTFYKDVYKLPASHYLIFENNTLNVKRYYSPLNNKISIFDKTDAIDKIDSELNKSVYKRLSDDVNLAFLLSGGLDSSLITSIASKKQKIQTYSLGFDEFNKYNELDMALYSSKLIASEHTQIKASKNDFLDSLDETFYYMDEPINDPASSFLYILMQHIKKDNIDIVYSGEGSDELFLGYRHYFEYLDLEKLSTLKKPMWAEKYFKSNYNENREWEWYKRVFEKSLLFRSSGEKFTDIQQNKLFKKKVEDNHSLRYLNPFYKHFKASEHKDMSSWYSYLDLYHFQAEHFLTKLDRVSMAHSIEARSPFLDHKLVDTVFSIDPKLKYQNNNTKDLLKKVASRYLDTKIINQKKRGFSTPFNEWIQQHNINIILDVNRKSKLFNEDYLITLLAQSSKGRFKQHLWALYVFSVWYRKEFL